MELRSKIQPLAAEGNYVSVTVGKYTYKIDLLTLLVYDENNCKYTIAELLGKALDNEAGVQNIRDGFNEFKENQDAVNEKLGVALDACLNYIKALQDKVITLQTEISKLKN